MGKGGAALLTRPPGYVLDPAAGDLDAERFERDLASARELAVEATRLEELRLAALELRNDARIACGDEADAIGDLEDLMAVMSTTRLLTLTGPGGVGKSTLGAEIGRRLVDGFADGVRLVELATVREPGAVVAAVARSLDVERRPGRSLAESITEVLGSRNVLLILDNCEHVVGTVGELVTKILRWCPQVRLVATSREPIGVPGETVRPVAPLVVPQRADDPFDVLLATPAMQVFVARAGESAPAFEITQRSAPAIAELCIALDGLPLALELAAARMASMSPRQLADRLHERFALLEAAEDVVGVSGVAPAEVAHLLAALVDKSMVVVRRTGGDVRYTLAPTVLATVGYGCFVRGELDRAAEMASAAIDIRTRSALVSCGLPERLLGNVLFYQGEREGAIAWIERLVEVRGAPGATPGSPTRSTCEAWPA